MGLAKGLAFSPVPQWDRGPQSGLLATLRPSARVHTSGFLTGNDDD